MACTVVMTANNFSFP